MLKKLLGLAPQPTNDGAFSPSVLALKLATSPKSDYDHSDYADKLSSTHARRKILVLCTQERNMPMANGTLFSTGNHPVEMLVPMLHFEKAGFEMEIYTPTGAPVQIEMWAFPHEDTDVQRIYRDYKAQFEQPKNLHDFVANDMAAAKNYAAIFIPGGHGAMLGLPENQDVKKLLLWTQQQDLMMCAICHGPAALLAAAMGEDAKNFMYRGYKMTAFPDAADRQTPLVGYMPGHLTWAFGKCLQDLGVEIVNKKADASVLQDRNLVTGASPKAANAFGKLATQALLKKENKQTI